MPPPPSRQQALSPLAGLLGYSLVCLFINVNGGFGGKICRGRKGAGGEKSHRGVFRRRSQMCKPRDSLGYLLDPFFSCPASPRIKERKSIKSAFSRADNGKESQAPDRGTAATFISIKPCTSITPKLNKPPLEDSPLQRLSQPRARYYF